MTTIWGRVPFLCSLSPSLSLPPALSHSLSRSLILSLPLLLSLSTSLSPSQVISLPLSCLLPLSPSPSSSLSSYISLHLSLSLSPPHSLPFSLSFSLSLSLSVVLGLEGPPQSAAATLTSHTLWRQAPHKFRGSLPFIPLTSPTPHASDPPPPLIHK